MSILDRKAADSRNREGLVRFLKIVAGAGLLLRLILAAAQRAAGNQMALTVTAAGIVSDLTTSGSIPYPRRLENCGMRQCSGSC